jgi:hypothetical protein
MVNPGEASLNVVTKHKPKVLRQHGQGRIRLTAAGESGLGQKGTWSGPGAPNSPHADGVPPAKRRGLNHPTCFTCGTW